MAVSAPAMHAPAAPVASRVLDGALGHGFALVRRAEAAGYALALDGPGNFDLPPSGGTSADAAHVRAIAALYLASELEATRAISCVESIAALAVGGGLSIDLGSAADELAHFWRTRNERATATERRALFARLFGAEDAEASDVHGGAPNHEFEVLFIDLCEALYKVDDPALDGSGPGPAAQTRIRVTAARAAENLTAHSSGVVAYLAGDILATLKVAIGLLARPELQRGFGTNALWDLVRAVARRYLHAEVSATDHVSRGKSGMLVLSWLADALAHLDAGGGDLVASQDPVVTAAAEWLQSSLSLSETEAAARAGA